MKLNRINIFFRFLFVLSLVFNCTIAEGKITNPPERNFDIEKIREYQADKDFFYTRQDPPPNLWERLINWTAGLLKKIFKDVPKEKLGGIVEIIFEIVQWGIIVFAVVMLILGFFKKRPSRLLVRGDKTPEIDYEELEKKVTEVDWRTLYEEEIKNKRFRTATRLMFLHTLQSLHKKELIVWDKNKTNRDFIYELHESGLNVPFQKLVNYYNYIWFGDFAVDSLLFEQVHLRFREFLKTVNTNVEKV